MPRLRLRSDSALTLQEPLHVWVSIEAAFTLAMPHVDLERGDVDLLERNLELEIACPR